MTSKKTLKMYTKLHAVLHMAYDRAVKGKGKERHANNQPFEEQVMARVNRLTGGGFSFGQILKKMEEIPNLPNERARMFEMLDIIVYAAGYVLVKEELSDKEQLRFNRVIIGNIGGFREDNVANIPGMVVDSGYPSKEEGK